MLELLLVCLTVLQNAKPYDWHKDYRQLYEVDNVEIPHEGEFETIRDVDFGNLTIHVFDQGSVFLKAKLRRGKYERVTKSGGQWVHFLSVHYPEAHGEEPIRAVAKFEHSSGAGSTCYSVFIQVFELRGKQLFLTQNIRFGEGTLKSHSNNKRDTLNIVAIHPCDDNA
ncbi:MAG TPA: hypothetical protein VGQ11_00905, partial [Candidatus Acidoferrales bacterium]|nr:hypothetical protein [Candidatus Acidoferrales bacterium]